MKLSSNLYFKRQYVNFCKRYSRQYSMNSKSVYGGFINGKEYIGNDSKYFDVLSPSTGEKIYKVASFNKEETEKAILNSKEVFDSGIWSKSDVRYRANVLNTIAQSLREQIPRFVEFEVAQTGRAIREMKAQLGRLPEWFEYFAAVIRTHEGSCPPFLGNYLNYVKRVPLGPCALLTPWNHPLLIAVKKIAPALATGNTVVLKPSELAPVTVLEFAKLCTEAGLPDGVLNVVPGLGPEVGQYLCNNSHIRKVDLTGGTSTGRAVGASAGANLASIISELGGKAPMIMFEDCDIDQAINGSAFATFIASGQTCIMGARLLVHSSIYDQFIHRLKEKVERIRLGDPWDDDTQMGPVISAASRERISKMVNTSIEQGARVITGASIPDMPKPFNNGFYYKPTILEIKNPHLDPTARSDGLDGLNNLVWREEVFGPVVIAVKFDSEEEAIRLANDSPYGLAAAVWTKNVSRAHRVAENLDVGIVWINDHHKNDPSSPWGGFKDSGIGRENGLSAFHEYTQTRSVVVKTDDSKFDWFEQKNARYS